MTVEEIQEAIEAMEQILVVVPKSRMANVLGCANTIFLALEKAKREAGDSMGPPKKRGGK